MKTHVGFWGIAAVVALLIPLGCPSTSAVKDITDADAMQPGVLAACAQLRVLGCDAGAQGVCESTLDRIETERLAGHPLTPMNLACVAAAKSKEAVRACGSITCP